MKRSGFHIVPLILIIIFLSSLASAREIVLTLEYYHTDDKDIIDRVYRTELINEEHKQKLYADLIIADEGSRRTLNELLDIFEWYQISQFRKALTWKSRIFSEDIIVPENAISSRIVMISERELDVIFNVKSRKKHAVPVGMRIIYDNRELYRAYPKVYPMDKFILLHDLNLKRDGNEELEVLILKITNHETEEPSEEEDGQ